MSRRQRYFGYTRTPRERRDDAIERDIQDAARRARQLEAQEARDLAAAASNEPAPAQEQQKPQGEQKHD